MSLPHFLNTNSQGLLRFLIPGHLADLCTVFGAAIFCIAQAITRKYDSITLLVFTSVSITICASLARVYPYGGIRQCLFLAPVFALFAGVAVADLLARTKKSLQPVATVAVMALILLSLYRGTLKVWPYGEYEDTQSILKKLARSSAPTDQVWVNHDAVPAFEFYLQEKDHRFIYGRFHANAKEYIPELMGSIDQRTDRLWLVFSHLQQQSDHDEEQLVIDSLRPGWEVQSVIEPTNAALYVAHRKTQLQSMPDDLAAE
jgi:hypothetical protein